MMENKDASQAEIDAVTKKLSEALRQLDPEGTINKEASAWASFIAFH